MGWDSDVAACGQVVGEARALRPCGLAAGGPLCAGGVPWVSRSARRCQSRTNSEFLCRKTSA